MLQWLNVAACRCLPCDLHVAACPALLARYWPVLDAVAVTVALLQLHYRGLELIRCHSRFSHARTRRPPLPPTASLAPALTPSLPCPALPCPLQLKRNEADEDAALGIFTDNKAHLVVALTTDRGLCGSVNNSIGRSLRKELDAAAVAGSNVRLFVLGDKGRAQIARDYAPIVARAIDSYLDRCVAVQCSAAQCDGPAPPAPPSDRMPQPSAALPSHLPRPSPAPLCPSARFPLPAATPSSRWPPRSPPASSPRSTTC